MKGTANKITLLRIISLPLLVWFLSRETKWMAFLALVTFVALSVTDWLDGYVARNRGEVTSTGKLLDPVADKLLIMTALLPLIRRGLVPAWLGIILLGREFIINGLRMVAAADRKIIPAGDWGKTKTTLYIIGLSLLIGAPILPPFERPIRILGLATLLVGMALAVVSAAEYFRLYNPSQAQPPSPES